MKYYELQDLYFENISKNDLLDILQSNADIKEYYFILHNFDVYENDILDNNGVVIHSKGELKKPHYHCCILFEDYGRYTMDKVRAYFKPLNTHIKNVTSFKKFIRYLVHFEDKNKYQYDVKDVYTSNTDKLNKQFILKDNSINLILDNFIKECYACKIIYGSDIINFFQAQNKLSYCVCHFKSLETIMIEIRSDITDFSNNRKEDFKRC